MATHDLTTSASPIAPPRVPPLENGDRLTRDEFERRYAAMPNLKKAELLEGVVHMPAAALRWNQHGHPHSALNMVFAVYGAHTPGVQVGDNSTVRLDLENEPQPDLAMIIDPACGGQVRISVDDYIEGGPEAVGEIASSSVSIDLTTKFRIYRRNGVREYVVWRVLDHAVDWFVLRNTDYDRLPLVDGIYKSEVFPGLWLAPEPLIRLEFSIVLGILNQGLQSRDHAEFVRRLQAARK